MTHSLVRLHSMNITEVRGFFPGLADVIYLNTSVRAGRVRLSLHFYNLEEEIDRVAGLIAGTER